LDTGANVILDSVYWTYLIPHIWIRVSLRLLFMYIECV
jgi:hypothetical protein